MMKLQALIMCSDEKILRVLRRVLSDLEINVEHCADVTSVLAKLTRKRFEAVIVDCHDEDMAAQVLGSVRSAPCNKRAVAVAMIDGQKAVRSAFALGAHFVLYKPISSERAKTSFRAARALMKAERRRNTRVAIEIAVILTTANGERTTVTSDLSEGGMAVRISRGSQNDSSVRIRFTLPGTESVIECGGKLAWENSSAQAGIHFTDIAPEPHRLLKSWLASHSPEIEKDDPPASCKLTDLSVGGCYLQIASPFPVGTRVILGMRIAQLRVQVQGVVRVAHPEIGMGLEFTRTTNHQREQVEKFIQTLMNGGGLVPELEVEPEGLDDIPVAASIPPGVEDPLLDLFRRNSEFTAEDFLGELRKQRNSHSDPQEMSISV